jgi:hypothetical protein
MGMFDRNFSKYEHKTFTPPKSLIFGKEYRTPKTRIAFYLEYKENPIVPIVPIFDFPPHPVKLFYVDIEYFYKHRVMADGNDSSEKKTPKTDPQNKEVQQQELLQRLENTRNLAKDLME